MSTPRRVNAAGIALIKVFESCRLVAYPDPKTGGPPWTCGWGSTGPDVVRGTVWTQAKADARFVEDLRSFERMVDFAVLVPTTPGQFSAMVSITYNVGPGSRDKDGIMRLKDGRPSTLLRKLNQLDYAGACAQFALWISPGSNVEKGLRRRRAAEQVLFNEPP